MTITIRRSVYLILLYFRREPSSPTTAASDVFIMFTMPFSPKKSSVTLVKPVIMFCTCEDNEEAVPWRSGTTLLSLFLSYLPPVELAIKSLITEEREWNDELADVTICSIPRSANDLTDCISESIVGN